MRDASWAFRKASADAVLLLCTTLVATACSPTDGTDATREGFAYDASASDDAVQDASVPPDGLLSDDTGPGDGSLAGDEPTVPEVSVAFQPTPAFFPNPERGFYGWSGGDFVTSFDAGSVQADFANGLRLVLALVMLADYRTTDLPASFLAALGQRFDEVRAAGMKTTLLFAYDFTAAGNDTTAQQIARHLDQLAPVLAEHADIIPYMRAGFIGAWGEWHSSQSGNSCGYHSGTTPCDTADANRLIVRDALLANVPATTQVAFRYPVDLMKWYPDPHQQERAGMHNDCFLAGPTDTGTYPDQAARDYAMALTENASFGGETCQNADTPLRSSCDDILAEGPAYHLAWLNNNYAPAFLDRWRADGCYDQVAAFMGYRLQIDRVTHPVNTIRASVVTVNVDLRNVGWARMFGQPRPIVVTLRPLGGGPAYTGASPVTLQSLPAQSTTSTRLTVAVAIPASATVDDYEVLVSAPDPSQRLAGDTRFAVRFANADVPSIGQVWDGTAATFSTGTTVSVR